MNDGNEPPTATQYRTVTLKMTVIKACEEEWREHMKSSPTTKLGDLGNGANKVEFGDYMSEYLGWKYLNRHNKKKRKWGNICVALAKVNGEKGNPDTWYITANEEGALSTTPVDSKRDPDYHLFRSDDLESLEKLFSSKLAKNALTNVAGARQCVASFGPNGFAEVVANSITKASNEAPKWKDKVSSSFVYVSQLLHKYDCSDRKNEDQLSQSQRALRKMLGQIAFIDELAYVHYVFMRPNETPPKELVYIRCFLLQYAVCSAVSRAMKNQGFRPQQEALVELLRRVNCGRTDKGGSVPEMQEAIQNPWKPVEEKMEKILSILCTYVEGLNVGIVKRLLSICNDSELEKFASAKVVYISEESCTSDKSKLTTHCEIKLFLYLTRVLREPVQDLRFYISKPLCADCAAFFYTFVTNEERPEFRAWITEENNGDCQQISSFEHFDRKRFRYTCAYLLGLFGPKLVCCHK